MKAAIPGIPEVEIPAPVDAVLASYKCGPLSFDVTASMVASSVANKALAAAGQTVGLKTFAGGMKSITVSNDGLTPLGEFPTSGAKPAAVFLSSDAVGSLGAGQLSFTDGTLLGGSAGSCAITDNREAPKAGVVRTHLSGVIGWDSAQYRYTDVDGKLAYTFVGVGKGGDAEVSYYADENLTPVRSDTVPSKIRKANGVTTVEMNFATPRNGYSGYRYTLNADGSGDVLYRDANGNEANLTTMPSQVTWNASGTVTYLWSQSSGGHMNKTTYNNATGNNWDGSYPKLADLNAGLPFDPSKF